ncbi:glycosyltransferase family 39 protein [Zhouia spongiae]|uniref:Glycosyltransferase family 39 protein n=1 Tax=Zhouia spongiae TaxID=2202721 RepID=A0ABY3YQS2_9FLAO|nr:glycosyltransferase family 39 protein [Zhouia spongiae]UNZ00100.1 glycosyltransferase family 39 protein [Zhouia spongiae]
MQQTKKSDQTILIFLSALTGLNLLQSYVTELIFDEAYYWYFAKDLAWGYFDHPPAVAFFVKLGSLLFNGELGVRFFAPFLFSGAIFLIWKLIDSPKKHEHTLLFCLLSGSVALLNAYGFFMLPDTPLIFFSTLFLFSYKNFLNKKNTKNILMMALSMSLMMYSKYHAFLLIAFVFLANISLLLNVNFWKAVGLSLVFYAPHLWWLSANDFAPLRYHFFDRADSYYKITYTTEYLLGLIGIMGFAFPWIYYSIIKTTNRNSFDRSLKFAVWGIIIFFLFSSFNRRTQAQWPMLIAIPLIIFTFRYALNHKKFRKGLAIASSVSLAVVCFLRLAMIEPALVPFSYETHGNKKWTAELKEKSKGLPVVFSNSYRNASMYSFYTGVDAFSLNDLQFRLNQYDLDTSELRFQHKKVALMINPEETPPSFMVRQAFKERKISGIFVNDFSSWRKVKIKTTAANIDAFLKPQNITLQNPYNEDIDLHQLKMYGIRLDRKKRILDTLNITMHHSKMSAITANSSLDLKVSIADSLPENSDAEFFRLAISENDLPCGFQGDIIPVR